MPESLLTTGPASRVGPNGPIADERQWRARTERITVRPLGAGRYEVTGQSGAHYLASVAGDWCTCPDHLMRGERCKHLHRVGLELAGGSVPGPDQRITLCAACDRETAIDPAAEPPLCPRCRLTPGDVAVDRETGDPVIVVAVLADRADEVAIPEARSTVAAYPSNRSYPSHDPVVRVVYPGSIRPVTHAGRPPKQYAFPISRLRPVTGAPDPRPRPPAADATVAVADHG